MQYKLRYLPLFEQDLLAIITYISDKLHNTEAANTFIEELEKSILERRKYPLAFEPYPSKHSRQYPYYRIYIGNYTAYYVVIDDTMEMRRLIYSPRNVDDLL